MRMTLIFPSILIILDIGAALVYAMHGNWRLTTYWIAAAVLTLCVIWGE